MILSGTLCTPMVTLPQVEIKVVDDARKTLPPGYEGEESLAWPPMCLWGISMNLN